MRYIRTTPNDIELKYTETDFPLVFQYIGPNRTHGDGYYDEVKYAWYECLKENNDLIYDNGNTLALICVCENNYFPNSIHLSVLEVIKQYQNQGIGKTIITDFISIAESEGKTSCTLQARTVKLKTYYAKLGFNNAKLNKIPIMWRQLYARR